MVESNQPAETKPTEERKVTPTQRNGQRRIGVRLGGGRAPHVCPFCAQKAKTIDYKQVDLLRRYLTDHGKIKARRKVGTCAKHQRMLAVAIKRARHVALLPFVAESLRGE